MALGHEVREAHRHEGILAMRCWSLENIDTTSEQVFPEDLAQRLRELRLEVTPTGARESEIETTAFTTGR
jgi:hypothetical protein